jgi:hypothetical protein
VNDLLELMLQTIAYLGGMTVLLGAFSAIAVLID